MRKATGGVPAEGQSVLMDPRGFQIKSDGSVNQDSLGVPSLVLCLSLCLSLSQKRSTPHVTSHYFRVCYSWQTVVLK